MDVSNSSSLPSSTSVSREIHAQQDNNAPVQYSVSQPLHPRHHGPHMGKKPPPSVIRNKGKKNSKRKPPSSSKASGGSGGVKPRGRPPKQRPLSRQTSSVGRNSSKAARCSGVIQQMTITNDEEPDRFTNPLLAILPESVSKRAAASAVAAAGESPSTIAVPTPSRTIIPVSELMNSAAIVFHRPDTYPISYLARVLGFDVDVPDMNAALRLKYGEESGSSMADSSQSVSLPPFPAPITDPQTLPFRQDDIFFQVPPLGKFFEQNKLLLQSSVGNNNELTGLGDHDDQQVLDYMDPLYEALLKNGWHADRARPLTAGGAQKFVQQQVLQQPTRVQLTETARELLRLPEEWTFQDWASYYGRWQTQESPIKESTLITASTPQAKTRGITEDITAMGESSADVQARGKSGTVDPLWTIDGNQVFSHLPNHVFGILACYKGQPVALLKYQFQWYYMLDQIQDMEESPINTELPQQPVEAELTMMINGFGRPITSARDKRDKTNDSVLLSDKDSDGAATEKQTQVEILESTAGEYENTIKMMMLSMALEHTRACGVWYGVWNVPQSLVGDAKRYFRMTNLPTSSVMNASETEAAIVTSRPDAFILPAIPMVCDLKKCSSRYAILLMRDGESEIAAASGDQDLTQADSCSAVVFQPVRMLVNLPSAEKARSYFQDSLSRCNSQERAETRKQESMSESFTSASTASRFDVVRLQAKLEQGDTLQVLRVTPTGLENLDVVKVKDDKAALTSSNNNDAAGSQKEVKQAAEESQKDSSGGASDEVCREQRAANDLKDVEWNFLRYFPVLSEMDEGVSSEADEVLSELAKKQNELSDLEKSLEPMARNLLTRSIEDRIEYEKPEGRRRREETRRILKQNEDNVTRRKEMDQVWQNQLEQDMNAVCSICNDGEVTPENQILFCEACNVAVHQLCYGIDKVPDGDYYCIACRYFKRDRLIETLSDRQLTLKDSSSTSRTAIGPLPICCELCPVKQGAYTQSACADSAEAKWVHMTCAKWQGLDFIKKNDPKLVEDVTELKRHFRRLEIVCCICQGMRGAYNKCRREGCENWCHVTCARESGLCDVVHGEDVVGFVEENPWTLLCPMHTNNTQEMTEEKKKKGMSVDFLMNAAKEFPVEPMPEPRIETLKPFNKLTASERKEALNLRSYEDEFIKEILTKKLAGVRCEVCDGLEDDAKSLARCTECGCVVCFACQLIEDADMQEQRNFKCYGCLSLSEQHVEQENDGPQSPQCSLCHQKGGLLLRATASPISKKSYWKQNAKEYERSLFGTTRFAHALCTFWSQNVRVNHSTCIVDTSNVVMSNGRQFVKGRTRCGLCGLKSGLKSRCINSTCRAPGESKIPYHFHITCARQAGLEASHDDNPSFGFYLHCYAHGSNEHNFRARLEDLIEIEKIRVGKRFTRLENPMTFSVASKLLNSAIVVLRMLGWAWRWAEWWVKYGSSWEPLLEPGQKESSMTAEELRIVESTKESRRDDARRCRLAAFGAALRNRCYDSVDGFETYALEKALRAVLNTPSLVGPLQEFEIEFFVEWLGRAYRSRSRLLGFGDDTIAVASESFCLHRADGSPKFLLGDRPLPGRSTAVGEVFEPRVIEPDDFLLPELTEGGEISSLDPLPEINYRHKGFLADDHTTEKKREPSDRSTEKKQEPSARSTEKKRKLTARATEKKREPSDDDIAPASKRQKRDEGKGCVQAVVDVKDWKKGLQIFAASAPKPKSIQLKIALKVGGEDFISPKVLSGEVESEKVEDTFDWSGVAMESVFLSQLEFLKGIGITSVQEFMTASGPSIAEQYVTYRKEHGLAELKGRSVSHASCKTIFSWRAKVRAYAQKEGIDVSSKAPGTREVEGVGGSETTLSTKEVLWDASELSVPKHPPPPSPATKSPRFTGKRKPDAAKLDKKQEYDRRSLDVPVSSMFGDVVSEFLCDAGVSTAEGLLHASPTKLGTEYASWRETKNLSRYSERSAQTAAYSWRRRMKDRLSFSTSKVDGNDRTTDATSNAQETAKKVVTGEETETKSPPKKRRRVSKKKRSLDDPCSFLPKVAIEFLHEEKILDARSLLETPTKLLSGKFVAWRAKHGMSVLRGNGAGATVSSWKARIRSAAEEAGDLELASLNRERQCNSKTGMDQEQNDDLDHDKCMFCGQGGTLIICDGCEMSCHLNCLTPPLSEVPEDDFYCPVCKQQAVEVQKEGGGSQEDNGDDECMICKEVGDLLICDGCDKSCHMHCLIPPLTRVPDGDFYCPECKAKAENRETHSPQNESEDDDNDECMICGDGGDLLICDGCEKSCHMQCLNPPLEKVPDGDFFCPDCSNKPPSVNTLNEEVKTGEMSASAVIGEEGVKVDIETPRSDVKQKPLQVFDEAQVERKLDFGKKKFVAGELNEQNEPLDGSAGKVVQRPSFEPDTTAGSRDLKAEVAPQGRSRGKESSLLHGDESPAINKSTTPREEDSHTVGSKDGNGNAAVRPYKVDADLQRDEPNATETSPPEHVERIHESENRKAAPVEEAPVPVAAANPSESSSVSGDIII